MVQIIYDKGRTKRRHISQPIDNAKMKVIMLGFGLLFLLVGFNFNDIMILLDGDPITKYVVAGMILFGVLITFIELGIKRFTDFSKLKGFSNQQLITFWINIIILGAVILNLSGFIETFSTFAGGSLIIEGILIIVEVFR